ncbi:oxidoreductase-like protein [Stipitochalara longipes BDJ]|nr:oxidoreductase-like protein [Stipitochalara longipes BDJ]
MGSVEGPIIPVVDFSPWTSSGSKESRLKAAKELVKACHETGVVYISNHGIPESNVAEAFQWMQKFFALPDEKKMEVVRPPETLTFRGYQKVGAERAPVLEGEKRADVPDHNESYSLGSDANLEQPNIWVPETTLPGFQPFMKEFYASCWKSAEFVLRALALGLGIDDDELLLQYHGEGENQLAIRHYPPIKAQVVEDGKTDRLGTHSDFDSFTLLWQDANGGLQFKVPGTDVWTSVMPIEGAVLMNIGDVLQRWSNGKLQSTLHRVHLPPREENFNNTGEDRMTNERFSMPFFVPPKFDVLIKPLASEYIDGDSPSLEPITFRQLFEEKMARMKFG